MKKTKKKRWVSIVTFSLAVLMIMGLVLPTLITFIQILQFGKIAE